MIRYILFLFSFLIFCTCKSPAPSNGSHAVSPKQKIIFLDSISAAQTIVKDDMEQFFKRINRLDISIQLKRNFPDTMSDKSVAKAYQDFLKTDVTHFSAEEISFISKIGDEMLALSEKVDPNIFPKEMWLIKSHGKHYGSSAYYTRENGVVIPKQALDQQNADAFLGVMFHELFHIYSRLNPEKRKALYARIGFKKLGPIEYLKMPKGLRERILLNPDGVDYAYAITLQGPNGQVEQAIPIITANETQYVNNKKEFFDYIHFDLYPISSPLSRLIPVKADNDGKTDAGLLKWPDFHRQIGTNTGYIIHPDEILADNFMYLMMSKRDASYLDRFTEEGRKLIADIEKILKE